MNVKMDLVCVMCRPDLIEYNKLTKAVPTYNLNNAFNVAEDRLGLTRLLDPEGQSFSTVLLCSCYWHVVCKRRAWVSSVKKLLCSSIYSLHYKTRSCVFFTLCLTVHDDNNNNMKIYSAHIITH